MISIIVAMDEKRGIGKDNALMWHIPGELPRFKKITTGHPIIMGRKTFDSIGRVLPNRTNIVITRHPLKVSGEGYKVAPSLEEAIEIAKNSEGSEEIFIIGGGQIFNEALDKGIVDRLYLTLVTGDFKADTFFPEYKEFTREVSKEEHKDENYTYTFLTVEK